MSLGFVTIALMFGLPPSIHYFGKRFDCNMCECLSMDEHVSRFLLRYTPVKAFLNLHGREDFSWENFDLSTDIMICIRCLISFYTPFTSLFRAYFMVVTTICLIPFILNFFLHLFYITIYGDSYRQDYAALFSMLAFITAFLCLSSLTSVVYWFVTISFQRIERSAQYIGLKSQRCETEKLISIKSLIILLIYGGTLLILLAAYFSSSERSSSFISSIFLLPVIVVLISLGLLVFPVLESQCMLTAREIFTDQLLFELTYTVFFMIGLTASILTSTNFRTTVSNIVGLGVVFGYWDGMSETIFFLLPKMAHNIRSLDSFFTANKHDITKKAFCALIILSLFAVISYLSMLKPKTPLSEFAAVIIFFIACLSVLCWLEYFVVYHVDPVAPCDPCDSHMGHESKTTELVVSDSMSPKAINHAIGFDSLGSSSSTSEVPLQRMDSYNPDTGVYMEEKPIERTSRSHKLVSASALKSTTTGILLYFTMLLLSYSIYSTLEEPNEHQGNTARRMTVFQPNPNKYPICGMRWFADELDVLDLAGFAAMGYRDEYEVVIWADSYYPNWKIIGTSAEAESSVEYYGMRHNITNETMVIIRGSYALTDWIQDADMWGEALMLQVFSSVLPFGPGTWNMNIQQDIVQGFSVFDEMMPVKQSSYYKDVQEYVQSLVGNSNVTNDKMLLVGHSLGGGIGKIVGSLVGVQVVAFNSPGVVMSAEKFDISTEAIYTNTISINSDIDIISKLDSQAGMIQVIQCAELGEKFDVTTCHIMEEVAESLSIGCGITKPYTVTSA